MTDANPVHRRLTYPRGLSRRDFLRTGALGLGATVLPGPTMAALQSRPSTTRFSAADLPQGTAPLPVPYPHFPDRLHAFVWRNWPLVPVERMAQVVGARPADILRLGRAMGLDGPPRISRDQQRRSYLTIIRRNWHLVPYEQLLALLDWSAEELAYALREDDFLFIKLGSLKPRCEPLRWQPPDKATQQRERAIADLVRREFPKGVTTASDPLFGFVDRLSRKAPPLSPRGAQAAGEVLRFCYSYFALYGDPLLSDATSPYPDGLLMRLAAAGVNGVWLQAVLYKLAPFPWDTALSAGWRTRLKNLRALVARAGRHGMRVFLYLNEPRAMPLEFFAAHPQLKGAEEAGYATLCTSVPEVQRYLVDAVASICRAVPDLGGFFTITASENLTNCWSHGTGGKCPRCSQRPPAHVIAEVNRLVAEGIRRGGSTAQLLVWDWGWNDAWAEEVIRQLPTEAALMSVSEWSLPIERGGVKSAVNEYSISAVGPGPRAQRHWAAARQRGLKTIAKIQAGTTWELGAVPHLPAVANVARHAANLRQAGVEGLMLGWTLGGYPSANLEVVSEALSSGAPEAAMQRVAERRFGAGLAPAVVRAWQQFSAAFSEFPFHVGVVYSAPLQLGPANLLWASPTGYRATMTGFPYDDLDTWRAIYPPEVFAGQLEKVAEGSDRALAALKAAVAADRSHRTPTQQQALAEELSAAEAAAIHFRTTANQARFVMARAALLAAHSAEEAQPHIETLERLLRSEMALARRLHELQGRDSRLGFEASNHYFYVSVDLAEKVLNCQDLLERWLPAQRARWTQPDSTSQ